MIQNVYMLFDSVANMFIGSLTIVVNDAVAMRSFSDLFKNPQFPFSRFADSIQLFKVGTINVENGEIVGEKKFICDCRDLVKKDGDE